MKSEEHISLKLKMGLNDNATTHLADKKIKIPMNIAPDYPITLPEHQPGQKSHLSQNKMIFYGKKHNKSRGQ